MKPIYFQEQKQFTIGNIKITPYFNDHSAIDSYGFLIEADGKGIYYTGDFRGHGKNPDIFKTFKKNPPGKTDCLLMEGTSISRSGGKEKTEKEIENELTGLFRQDKINLVYSSGQNIDRLLAIYEACKAAGKILVFDFYIANFLRVISYCRKIPFPSAKYPNIKVIYPKLLSNRMGKDKTEKYLFAFAKQKIAKEKIDRNPGNYVMIIRPSMKSDIELMKNIDGGNFIYSLWKGYLKKKYTADFINYLRNRNFDFYEIHTSGHADIETLKEMVRVVNPKVLIPIHTFEPGKYKTMFKVPVKELKDGEEWDV